MKIQSDQERAMVNSRDALSAEQRNWARILSRDYPNLDDTMVYTIVTTPIEELEKLLNNERKTMGTLTPAGGSVDIDDIHTTTACASAGPESSSHDSK